MEKVNLKQETWVIFIEFGVNSIPYVIKKPKNVSSNEFHLCILEQFYEKEILEVVK